jgi:hypothetical protein
MRNLTLPMVLVAAVSTACSSTLQPTQSGSTTASGDSDSTSSGDSDRSTTQTSSCEANSSYSSSLIAAGEEAYVLDNGNYTITAQLADTADNGDATAYLYIELYPGYGALADGLATGTYTISDADTSYATCGLCVFLLTVEPSDSDFSDYGVHLATSGTVKFTKVSAVDGGTVAATLSNVELAHVDVDTTTGETTADSDGCTTSLPSASFSIALAAGTTSTTTDSTCSANASYDGTLALGYETGTYYTDLNVLQYWGLLDETLANSDWSGTYVMLDIAPGYGAIADGVASGTAYTLTADDTSYATCGLCVFLVQYDAGGDWDYYLATAGTVTFSDITSASLAGSLANFVFQHVTLTSSGSTAAGDSCDSAMASFSFSTTVTDTTSTAAN